MARIILISGKGGVGKTTVAAATGLAAARRGYRTLVLSFDLAHSLRDAFDLEEALFMRHQGLPTPVAERLEALEIDVQDEMERHWGEIYRYSATLMMGGGLEEVVAEEVAIMPGMEDIVALLRLNQAVAEQVYDVIVLDCPPTSEALRFLSFSSSLDWYARKRLKTDRQLLKLARPLTRMLSESTQGLVPSDDYFAAVQALFHNLDGVDQLLRDPAVTSVRLVTNAEKMVVRETQRAFMYFCMYGMTTDAVIINRLLPVSDGYFAQRAQSQADYADNIRDYFAPVPVYTLPYFAEEVVGLASLERLAQQLYEDRDAAEVFVDMPPYGFRKEADGQYRLELRLPFAPKDQIDLSRNGEDMVVRIGAFKRNILLPRAIAPLRTASTAMQGDTLVVRFVGGAT